MCEMCDGRSAADLRARVIRTIENFGWLVQFVAAGPQRPSLAYTVGLTGFGLPEICVVGLNPQSAGELLNHAAELCLVGQLGPGARVFGQDGCEYHLGPASPADLFLALDVYGSTVRALVLRAGG